MLNVSLNKIFPCQVRVIFLVMRKYISITKTQLKKTNKTSVNNIFHLAFFVKVHLGREFLKWEFLRIVLNKSLNKCKVIGYCGSIQGKISI